MRGIDFYDRILDIPGPSTIPRLFYAGMLLVVAAVVLLSLMGIGLFLVVSLLERLLLPWRRYVTDNGAGTR